MMIEGTGRVMFNLVNILKSGNTVLEYCIADENNNLKVFTKCEMWEFLKHNKVDNLATYTTKNGAQVIRVTNYEGVGVYRSGTAINSDLYDKLKETSDLSHLFDNCKDLGSLKEWPFTKSNTTFDLSHLFNDCKDPDILKNLSLEKSKSRHK